MKRLVMMLIGAVVLAGCASSQPNSNALMMERTIGELDRETAR